MALFKYIPSEFVNSFLDGNIRFQPLSYYQRHENLIAIGDPHEAMRLFRPASGLVINNLAIGKRFTLPATFVSSVIANHIFVFCVSQFLSEGLAREFKYNACVEIRNAKRFIRKIQVALHSKPGALALIKRSVDYYDDADPIGVNWALPESIVMSKRSFYKKQQEYRFVIAERSVLEFGRTYQQLVIGNVEPTPVVDVPEPFVLDIGDIRSICSVHEWTIN